MLTPELLAKTQKSIFLRLQDHIQSYQIAEKDELKGYRKSFSQKKFNTFQKIDLKSLLEQTRNKKVVLFGDFHPFSQSQKGFLRFIKMRSDNAVKLTVALECLFAKDQAKLDAYLSGKITLAELEDEIHFSKTWPFPWNGYADILSFCKREKIHVLAINLNARNSKRSLSERDRFSAKIISDYLRKQPSQSVTCLIGELHLGKNHLPKHFPAKHVSIVHQNLDDLYFKSLKKFGQTPEVLKLNSNEYCAFNAVPWVKSQSFLDWIEGGFEDQSELDVYEQIYEFVDMLGSLVDLRKNHNRKVKLLYFPGRPEIATKTDAILFNHAKKYLRTELLPDCRTVCIPILSTNAKTEAAALYLKSIFSESPDHEGKESEFNKNLLIFHFLIGFLGSKILNPNRKCNEVEDLKNILGRKTRSKAQKKKSEIAAAALFELRKYLEIPKIRYCPSLPKVELVEALRLAGYILGNRVFISLNLAKESNKKLIRNFFLAKLNNKSEVTKLLNLVKKTIKKTTDSPKTKSDTL